MLDLDAIKARADAATQGPWVVGPVDDTVITCIADDGQRYEIAAIDGDYNTPETWPIMEANALFVAHARADVPALVAEVERLRAALHEIQFRSCNGGGWFEQDPWAEYCELGRMAGNAIRSPVALGDRP